MLAALDLERSALRTCLLDGQSWLLGSELNDSHFTSAAHKALWRTLCELAAEGEPLDTVNLLQQLDQTDRLRLVGGDEAVLALTESVDRCGEKQLKRLRELERVRTLQRHASGVLKACEGAALQPVLERVSELGLEASASAPAQRTYDARSLAALVMSHVTSAEQHVQSVYPGTTQLQHAIGFLPAGSMSVIAADTNVGKSSYALLMLRGLAARGVPVGYVSCEDGPLIVGSRLLAMVGDSVSGRMILRRDLSEQERAAVVRAGGAVDALPFVLEDCVGGTDTDVLFAMARLAAKGARLIVVDYVQTIQAAERAQDRRNEVRLIATRLKSQAARLRVALVVVSQLRRPENDNREPGKHDLKEAGDLENSAEVIVMLWRTEEDDAAPIHVKVAKCKWGGVGRRWTLQRDQTGTLREECG